MVCRQFAASERRAIYAVSRHGLSVYCELRASPIQGFRPINLGHMCGIVGYTGPHQALPFVLAGLGRLEYRGYDSAGVAVLDDEGHLHTAKKAGALVNLERHIDAGEVALNGTVGIGHTRWATHGGPTDRNAHPHTDMHRRVAVIHNGIIENFVQLRAELEASGVEFSSDTDTEVVAHLLSRTMADGPTAGDLPASMAA